MKWITAGDIKYWVTAKRRHCEQTLPELVRRLIAATAPMSGKIDFPSGDSVTTSGWDGTLETSSVSPFFPAGISGWEMGVEPTPGKKANSAYTARTKKPLGLTKKKSTFVFVTPRQWPGRNKWEIAKRKARAWKGVRAIAVDGLELWLESAPAVALWLARQLGKAPNGIRDLEAAWEEWSSATDPVMLPEVVSAGRESQVKQLHDWLAAAPGVFQMQGDSSDEVVAFLFAAITQLAEPEKMRALSRCVLVEDINQFRACVPFQPLVIAAPAQCREAAGLAVRKGHHVFVIADSNTLDFSGRLVQLSRPMRYVLEWALRKNGFSETDAHKLARDSGASIPVLRRHIFRASIAAPDWASPDGARLLLPVLLASAWIDTQEGDRTVIEKLTGKAYAEVTAGLDPMLSVRDAPLRKVANVWMLKSPLDAWFILARTLDRELLNRFRDTVKDVVGEVDPKYELEPDQRWAAAIYGKQARYSRWIEEGLVKSLVLLGVHGDRTPDGLGREFANAVVGDILASATTWQAWSSLKDITPLLAEAAPQAFLDALSSKTRENPTIFVELMGDDGTTFGECKHAGLLWALESLAWEPEYLSRAVEALASLAQLDPGGSWSNRPASSLRDIFLPAYPQTYAAPRIRLDSFDLLMAKSPELAWKVVHGLLGGGMISASHQFRWRPHSGRREPLQRESVEQQQEYINGLLPRFNKAVSLNADNVIGAVPDFVRGEVTQDAVLQALGELKPDSLSEEQRDQLLKNLREVLHWINSFGNDEQKERGRSLTAALEKFSPEDPLERHAWLLGNAWPNLPEGEPKEYAAKDALVGQRREQAARQVLNEVPLDTIVAYGSSVAYPGVYGNAFAKVVGDSKEDAAFVDSLLKADTLNETLLLGYAMGRVEAAGQQWLLDEIARVHGQGLDTPEAVAVLLLTLPENRTTWAAAASLGPMIEAAYWKRARGRSGRRDDDAQIAIEKMVEFGRPDAALSIAGDPNASFPSALLQHVLRAFLSFDPKEKSADSTMLKFYLEHVFRQLYDRNELSLEEIAQVEWPFAQILADEYGRSTSYPLAMHRALQKDPSFFALLVSFLYKQDDGTSEPISGNMTEAQSKNMRSNARQVLQTWRRLPGLADDGSVDEKALLDWIDAARRQCADTHHVTGGDIEIAKILARSPSDSDGMWPHRAVRNAIETLQNTAIERHIPITVNNDRGVTTRGMNDGGAQERALAERYDTMSSAMASRWPRTAAVLGTIAQSYSHDATHQDAMTDLQDLGWG